MTEFQKQLEEMRQHMWCVNCFFHITRNNPRTTYFFYHRLIIVAGGYDAWEYVDPAMKNAWESARLSFDQMYGLIKAWSETLTEVPKKSAPEDLTAEKQDALRNEMHILFETKEKLKAEKEVVEAEKALEKARNSFADEAKTECPLQKYSADATNIQVTFQKKEE